MNDVAAAVLLLVLPAVAVVGLLLTARSSNWSDRHSVAARRLGTVDGALGLAVAAFWVGRLFRWW